MFYPNTVWNSGNPVLDSAGQKARKFVVARVQKGGLFKPLYTNIIVLRPPIETNER